MTFGLKWLKKAFLQIAFIGLIASFAQTAAAIDFNFDWSDAVRGKLNITISLNASTVGVKVKLENGCVYNTDNVNVNWSQSTLEKFVKDLTDPVIIAKWLSDFLVSLDVNKLPIAVTSLDPETLQVRVGFTVPNPPGALVDVQVKLDTSTCSTTTTPDPAPTPIEASPAGAVYVLKTPPGVYQKTVPVNMETLKAYCGDDSGCTITVAMKTWTPLEPENVASFGPSSYFYSAATKFWRVSDERLAAGQDANGIVQHIMQVYDCILTDGEYASAVGTDTKEQIGLVNWNNIFLNPSKECVLVIRD